MGDITVKWLLRLPPDLAATADEEVHRSHLSRNEWVTRMLRTALAGPDTQAAPPEQGAVARRPKAVTQSAAPQPDRPTVDPPKVGGDPVVPTCQHVYIRQGGVRVCKRCGKEYTG